MDKQRVSNNPQNRDANAATRASMAVSMRAKRMTYDEIAKACGYGSASACRKAIMRELDRTVVRNVEELRLQELDMLDRLHNIVWAMAVDDKNKSRLFAIDRILTISERRSKLMGMDIPTDNGNLLSAQVIVRELPPGYFGEAGQ